MGDERRPHRTSCGGVAPVNSGVPWHLAIRGNRAGHVELLIVARPSGVPRHAPVAQRIEHLTTDQKVGGSNPSGRTLVETEHSGPLRRAAFFLGAIWFAVQADRSDADRGAAWAAPDPRLTYGAATNGWSVHPSSRSHAVTITAQASTPEPAERELVAYLVLPEGTIP